MKNNGSPLSQTFPCSFFETFRFAIKSAFFVVSFPNGHHEQSQQDGQQLILAQLVFSTISCGNNPYDTPFGDCNQGAFRRTQVANCRPSFPLCAFALICPQFSICCLPSSFLPFFSFLSLKTILKKLFKKQREREGEAKRETEREKKNLSSVPGAAAQWRSG